MVAQQLELTCTRCGLVPGSNPRDCPLCYYVARQGTKARKMSVSRLQAQLGLVCWEISKVVRAVHGRDWRGARGAHRQAQTLFAMQAART